MRRIAPLIAAALVLVPAASAKGRLSIRISDAGPAVNEEFAVDVRTGWVVPANDWLRLIAVAPGKRWSDVVPSVFGSPRRGTSIPRDGFEIRLTRVAPKHWRALVRLPRAGRWRLVVPNGTHVGYIVPPPTEWMPWVAVHR
jgi:hypothetical protein